MIKGHKTNAKVTEFGESIIFKIPKTKLNPGKFEDRWDIGTYVGFEMRSMESLVATPAGVFKVSDFRRRPLQERWSAEALSAITGSPKQPVPGQSYRRAPAFSKKFASDTARDEAFARQPMPEAPMIRNWKTFKTDVERHGPTDGCPGCRAATLGLRQAPHTPDCRTRMQVLIAETEEGQARLGRAAERATRYTEDEAAERHRQ